MVVIFLCFIWRKILHNVNAELINHIAYGDGGHCVEHLLDVRLERRKWYILVKWLGLESLENSWELAENIKEDVPAEYQRFVSTSRNPEVKRMNQALT